MPVRQRDLRIRRVFLIRLLVPLRTVAPLSQHGLRNFLKRCCRQLALAQFRCQFGYPHVIRLAGFQRDDAIQNLRRFLLLPQFAQVRQRRFIRSHRQLLVIAFQQLAKPVFLLPRGIPMPRQLLIAQAGPRRVSRRHLPLKEIAEQLYRFRIPIQR